jgi:hypothetical protein
VAGGNSLTLTGQGRLIELRCDIQIGAPGANPLSSPPTFVGGFSAIWDTGATGSVITQKVVDALGIKPIGLTLVHGANSSDTCEVYLVDIMLPSKVGMRGVRVTKSNLVGADALIGMDIITNGDFHISNVGGVTVMSFRVPSQSRIDYVKETDDLMQRRALPHGRTQSTSRQQRRKKRK